MTRWMTENLVDFEIYSETDKDKPIMCIDKKEFDHAISSFESSYLDILKYSRRFEYYTDIILFSFTFLDQHLETYISAGRTCRIWLPYNLEETRIELFNNRFMHGEDLWKDVFVDHEIALSTLLQRLRRIIIAFKLTK